MEKIVVVRFFFCRVYISPKNVVLSLKVDFGFFPIMIGSFAFLFNCTPVGQTSDFMTVPT